MWETGLEWAEAKIQAKLKVSLGQTVTGMEVSWITPRGDPSGLAGYYPSVIIVPAFTSQGSDALSRATTAREHPQCARVAAVPSCPVSLCPQALCKG